MNGCAVSGNTLKTRPSVMVSEGSLIHCFCLLRESPPPLSPEGGGWTDRKTDCPCSVFSFSSVWRLVRLRAQTCLAPFEGNLKSRAVLVGLTHDGVDQAFVWVVLMKKAEGGVKKRRRNGWGQRGQRCGCGNSEATTCNLECFSLTSFEHKVIGVH